MYPYKTVQILVTEQKQKSSWGTKKKAWNHEYEPSNHLTPRRSHPEAPLSRVGQTIRSATKTGATNKLRLVSRGRWRGPQAVRRVSEWVNEWVSALECSELIWSVTTTRLTALLLGERCYFCSSSQNKMKSSKSSLDDPWRRRRPQPGRQTFPANSSPTIVKKMESTKRT